MTPTGFESEPLWSATTTPCFRRTMRRSRCIDAVCDTFSSHGVCSVSISMVSSVSFRDAASASRVPASPAPSLAPGPAPAPAVGPPVAAASCVLSDAISCSNMRISRTVGSSLTIAAFTIFLAALAYRSVDSVSSKLDAAGEMAATINVLELPPSDSRRSHVSTDSRYGMCGGIFFPGWRSARAVMTLPRVESDLLIWFPSTMRSPFLALICPERSLPARSTSEIFDFLLTRPPFLPPPSLVPWVKMIWKMACDRELTSFIVVARTVRNLSPSSIKSFTI
mmetsp:Transcript_30718/g.92097  ORF Transcript_30718/g.92097 Transcript_30718/m.92097 type:complete len:280 (-) Transcript_30718:844-1683(-)